MTGKTLAKRPAHPVICRKKTRRKPSRSMHRATHPIRGVYSPVPYNLYTEPPHCPAMHPLEAIFRAVISMRRGDRSEWDSNAVHASLPPHVARCTLRARAMSPRRAGGANAASGRSARFGRPRQKTWPALLCSWPCNEEAGGEARLCHAYEIQLSTEFKLVWVYSCTLIRSVASYLFATLAQQAQPWDLFPFPAGIKCNLLSNFDNAGSASQPVHIVGTENSGRYTNSSLLCINLGRLFQVTTNLSIAITLQEVLWATS